MKVAVLIRRYITTGGAERYAVEVARRLAKGHEVHVFAQEWDHEPAGMVLHRVSRPVRKPNYLNAWWFSWRAARLARGFDVVYSHERVTRFDVMNIHCGTFVGGLWGAERSEPKGAFRTWLKLLTGPSIWSHWLLERCNNRLAPGRFWVADSQMVKREVQRYYPIPEERFFIAPSGVDAPVPDAARRRAEWRGRLGFKEHDVVALFVGSEFRRKGLGALIEALGRLGDRGPRLLVVGGQDRTAYERRAAQLQAGQRITWAGPVNNIQDYYALADIFVLPTLSDPSPLAPLEAMAYGCATVVSCGRFTGAAELASRGEALLLQDPRDPCELAKALESLMDPATRRGYAERGRQLSRQWSWDRTAEVVLAALEKSARERGRACS
ncbi:MAG: glycosyltransferase family 4 protein [Verrucomicrobiota bacterium]|jgi:UDP-glucose:(heptosyl)LPS alpha-1,3-glucosyltransferase